MTAPPLPASPTMRVKLDYTFSGGQLGGSRFYLQYAGGAPTAGNCVTLAGDIAAQWATSIAPLVDVNSELTRVDVLDIATLTGASGEWNGANAGTRAGASMPQQCAMNVEFGIARRYRGGKPRMFFPPGVTGDMADDGHWATAFVDEYNTAVAAFFAGIEALDIGAVGALTHVNLSYYSGFKNITNSSGRERAVPTYRDTALLDTITQYAAKAVIGSQRRRRTATTY